jgi:hypothetical protein
LICFLFFLQMECVCAAPRVAGVVGSRDVPAEAGVRAGAPGSLSGMQVGVATISMRSASPFFGRPSFSCLHW